MKRFILILFAMMCFFYTPGLAQYRDCGLINTSTKVSTQTTELLSGQTGGYIFTCEWDT